MTRHEIVKALWRDMAVTLPPRDCDIPVLMWREEPGWSEGWGMRGWAYFYETYAAFISRRKSDMRSLCRCLVDDVRKVTHWMNLPLPCRQYSLIDHVAVQSRLWINVDVRQPPIIKNGGYVLYNPISERVTVATGISAQNLVHYSRKTDRNRVRYWMPLVGPYDTI